MYRERASRRGRASSRNARRPVRQVDIKVKTPSPITSGNQPPWGILNRFAPRKAESTTNNGKVTPIALGQDQFHRTLATTRKSTVVMNMVIVTATPYAAARPDEDPKAITRPTAAIARTQLMWGTYTWPRSVADV